MYVKEETKEGVRERETEKRKKNKRRIRKSSNYDDEYRCR